MIIILTEGLRPEMGGPSTNIPNFALSLEERNIPVIILCPSSQFKRLKSHKNLKIMTYNNTLDFIKKLHKHSKTGLKSKPFLHLNYFWRFESLVAIIFGVLGIFSVVSNPRGMLTKQALDSGSVLKKPFFFLFLRPLLRFSISFFQTSSKLELEDLKIFFPNNKIFLNTLGLEKLSVKDFTELSPKEKLNRKELLVISRIDAYKNIGEIVRSFVDSGCYKKGWKLSIYGAQEFSNYENIIDSEILANLELLNIKLGLFLSEREKVNLLTHSTFFVSASKTESYGLSIAEAMALFIPVIIRNNTLWEDYITMGCGLSFSGSKLVSIFRNLDDINEMNYVDMIEKIHYNFQPVTWSSHTSIFLSNISYKDLGAS